ncbi:hypothetical protein KFK09_023467 [Dendrobium nobile]|uniref:PLC-like phosphodiesterases superfamily protein n=1 Tax=Dendrobium nobile TaxID=94219 RepID=A0A8T3AL52_DENNO|nr:hypothetical protein KFK09_023467 [Dendrobium nobile]
MASSPCLFQFLLSFSLIAHAAACAAPGCQLLNPCSGAEECAPGLYCGTCPASGKNRPSCTRGQATRQTDIEKGLPFNKYTWLVTHNSFSIVNAPSFTGVQRVTFYNQEDTVTNQLREPAINTLKEVEAFLTNNPTEIVTIFIEDYVRTPKGLSSLFTNADLMKYLYPLAEMPTNGKDWPTITEMAEKNYRLLVFTSVASKEAEEGIAYQWRYVLENEPGDPGILPGSCPNRRESQPLSSRYASLFLQNYFPTIPVQNDACKEHSSGLAEMVDACYKAAEKLMPNFLSVNFYLRSDGRGIFDILDRMNGLTLCGCPTVFACKPGAAFGVCKNISSSSTPTRAGDHGGGTYAGYVEFSGSLLRSKSFSFMEMSLFYCLGFSILSLVGMI